MPLAAKFIGLIVVVGTLMAAAYYVPIYRAERDLTISGVVEVQEVRLGSKIGGRVESVPVKEGEIAAAGQMLVEFAAPELTAQVQQQQSRVASAKANLEKAKNGPRPEEIRQAKSEVAALQADFELAIQELRRIEALFEGKKVTRSEYESAIATRDRMRGRMDSAQAHYDLLIAGTRIEDIQLAEASYHETQAKLKEIEANLAEANVVAPERCLVEVVAVRKGDLVPPNQPVLRVLRADDLWVRAYVPETRLGDVRIGQKVTIKIDSYPGKQFSGEVYLINSESEFTPRNIQSVDQRRYQVFGIKIRVENSEGIFKSGMAARVEFKEPPSDGAAAKLYQSAK